MGRSTSPTAERPEARATARASGRAHRRLALLAAQPTPSAMPSCSRRPRARRSSRSTRSPFRASAARTSCRCRFRSRPTSSRCSCERRRAGRCGSRSEGDRVAVVRWSGNRIPPEPVRLLPVHRAQPGAGGRAGMEGDPAVHGRHGPLDRPARQRDSPQRGRASRSRPRRWTRSTPSRGHPRPRTPRARRRARRPPQGGGEEDERQRRAAV